MRNIHAGLVSLVTLFVLLLSHSAFADVACPAGGTCGNGGGGGCSVVGPQSAIAFGMIMVGVVALVARRRKH
jgi:MYXO-CTERM domain-containing protein